MLFHFNPIGSKFSSPLINLPRIEGAAPPVRGLQILAPKPSADHPPVWPPGWSAQLSALPECKLRRQGWGWGSCSFLPLAWLLPLLLLLLTMTAIFITILTMLYHHRHLHPLLILHYVLPVLLRHAFIFPIIVPLPRSLSPPPSSLLSLCGRPSISTGSTSIDSTNHKWKIFFKKILESSQRAKLWICPTQWQLFTQHLYCIKPEMT